MTIPHRILIAIAALAAGLAALPGAARASWMTPPPPHRAKDFAIFKHDGTFHLFYIRHDPSVPYDSTEVDFGHAVSQDLYVWEHRPPIFSVSDSSWDSDHVWAPHIVERDSVFYMFYTGVKDQPGGPYLWQQTGLAMSTDLENWTRLDDPILGCGMAPWVFCDTMSAATAFRDPCVVPDITQPGRWLMVYSAFPASDPTSMVAGLATSDGDFTSWQDHSPLWISHFPVTGNGLVESPCLFERGGLYYLFFTTSHLQQIHFATTPDPTGDLSQWTYRGSLGGNIGLDTSPWYAAEHLRDGLVDYLAFVNGDRIDVRRIQWGPGSALSLEQPDVFHVVRLSWSADTAAVGDTLELTIETANGFGRPFPYVLVAIAPDGSETVLNVAQLGVSPAPTLWNSPATWTWTITNLPQPDTSGAMPTLVVRTPNRTCESPPLALTPPPPPPPPPPYYPPPAGGGPRVLKPADPTEPPELRTVEFGANPAMRIEIGAATSARLEIFDLGGRRVRVLADRVFQPGAHEVRWDGRGASGIRMPRGLYFARLLPEGQAPVNARIVLQ